MEVEGKSDLCLFTENLVFVAAGSREWCGPCIGARSPWSKLHGLFVSQGKLSLS